jgi:hypothetical protein
MQVLDMIDVLLALAKVGQGQSFTSVKTIAIT